jgi:hypothetical protein
LSLFIASRNLEIGMPGPDKGQRHAEILRSYVNVQDNSAVPTPSGENDPKRTKTALNSRSRGLEL